MLVGMKGSTPRDPDRTRERLLEAGFREIHRQGFQPASLEAIVEGAGVTKGALYHHFATKQALGYAVVDEIISSVLDERWITPLADAPDPVDALVALVRKAARAASVELGCPLNNLAQEMSGVDAGFQRRIERLYRRWEAGVARALERGQRQRRVRSDVDVGAAATFVVASIEGALGLAKTRGDHQPLQACAEGPGPLSPDSARRAPPVGVRQGHARVADQSRRPDHAD
jgi:TetR/AcrR family transcriptional regulator, transcriptional repressor for nem operon